MATVFDKAFQSALTDAVKKLNIRLLQYFSGFSNNLVGTHILTRTDKQYDLRNAAQHSGRINSLKIKCNS